MQHIDFRALEYLTALSKYGSLRKASKMIGVDPAAMSRKLSQLEEENQIKVWERGGNASVITDAGEELLRYHQSIIKSEASVLAKLNRLKGLKKGNIKIAIGEGFITDLIQSSLKEFMWRYPDISLSIEVAGAADAIKMLNAREVDFIITYASSFDHKLETHIERIHPLELIVPMGHPLALQSKEISAHGLKNIPVAIINTSTGMGKLVDHACEVYGLELEPKLQTNSVNALVSFVCSGLGVTFMPKLTVMEEIKQGKIEIVKTNIDMFLQARVRVQSLLDVELSLEAVTFMRFLSENTLFLKFDSNKISVD